jgi:nucleotide-binding universal stress UspA family protein
MFKQILVPLDGSPFAERALPVATALATSTGASLALVRAVELLAPGDREPGVVSYLDEHRIAVAQDYIREKATATGLTRAVSGEAYLAADVAAGILARAADIGADLIVMTSHGASWPAGGALGGVAAALTREAQCPVLVVGPRVVQENERAAAMAAGGGLASQGAVATERP